MPCGKGLSLVEASKSFKALFFRGETDVMIRLQHGFVL